MLKSKPTKNINSSTHRSNRIVLESYVKSNRPNNRAGDVIEMIWRNEGAKPFIGWYDGTRSNEKPKIKAWVGAHSLANDPESPPHNHWSIEVSDLSGKMQTRLAIPYDKDHTNITTSSADFTVGEGKLRVGGTRNRDLEFSEGSSGSSEKARFTLRLDSDNNFRIIPRNDSGSPTSDSAFTIDRLTANLGIGIKRPTSKLHIKHTDQAMRVEGTKSSPHPLILVEQSSSENISLSVKLKEDKTARFSITAAGILQFRNESNGNQTTIHHHPTRKSLVISSDLIYSNQTGPIIQNDLGNFYRVIVDQKGILKTQRI